MQVARHPAWERKAADIRISRGAVARPVHGSCLAWRFWDTRGSVMAIIDFPQGRSPEFPTLGLVVLG